MTPERQHRRLPRPRRRPQRGRLRPALPGRPPRPAAVVLGRRRRRHVAARARTACCPIESSLVGPVNETHDLLYDSALSIVAEAILPIRHCLVGPAAIALDDVREIRSHAGRARPVPRAARLDAVGDGGRRGDDGRRRGRGGGARRPGRRRDREHAGRPDARPHGGRGQRRRPRRPTRASPRSRPTRGSTGGTANGGRRSRSRPTTGPGRSIRAIEPLARRADRPGAARLAADPVRARSTTASTASSAATRSTTRSRRHSARCAPRPPAARVRLVPRRPGRGLGDRRSVGRGGTRMRLR